MRFIRGHGNDRGIERWMRKRTTRAGDDERDERDESDSMKKSYNFVSINRSSYKYRVILARRTESSGRGNSLRRGRLLHGGFDGSEGPAVFLLARSRARPSTTASIRSDAGL